MEDGHTQESNDTFVSVGALARRIVRSLAMETASAICSDVHLIEVFAKGAFGAGKTQRIANFSDCLPVPCHVTGKLFLIAAEGNTLRPRPLHVVNNARGSYPFRQGIKDLGHDRPAE
jgi:hypothetical protein